MKKIKIGEKHNICGERLQKMRKRRNLSQEDLAVKLQLNGLDLTQKTISRIENGKRLITDYELKYFTDVLNIPICGLFEQDFCCAAKRGFLSLEEEMSCISVCGVGKEEKNGGMITIRCRS